jgi:predicted lysophospholipase L1 biosynthesis ABC-type transport system permease subunit
MKGRIFWRYATRSLARGGQRTIFAVFCVAVGVMAIVALQLVANMVSAALASNIRAFHGGDLAVHSDTGIGDAQLTYFTQLQAQGDITSYSPATIDEATTTTAAGLQHIAFFAVDPATFPLAGNIPVLAPAGGQLVLLLRGGGVVVTDMAMQRLDLHLGQTLALTTGSGRAGSVTVAGEVATSGVITGRADLLMSGATYAGLANLTSRPIGYGWVFVNVPGHDDARAAALAVQIRSQFPLVTVTTLPEAQRQAQSAIGAIRTLLRIVGLLALLIGGVGIANTLQVLLRRRLVEIAMLKTQGYRQRDLLAMFGCEAALLGLAGGMLGALAGIGLSFGVRGLVESAFLLTLPATIDVGIVASGIGIGLATTLISGLLPIVRTSAVRPLAALRDGGATTPLSRIRSLGMLLLLGALFFMLALGILGNLGVTAAVVTGGTVVLLLLTGLFAVVAWALSSWPVPNVHKPGSLLPLVPLLLTGLALLRVSAGFGALLLAVVVSGMVVAALPRSAQAGIQLALRNIGRARVRSATTLLALFAGVFAVGLGLLLGRNVKDFIASRNAAVNQDNAYVLATSALAPRVAAQLAQLPHVTHELISLAVPDRIVAINGVYVTSTPVQGEGAGLSAVDGFDLGAGQLPPVLLAQGAQDTQPGRLLSAADAGTRNALFPLDDSQAPESLKLGDQVKLSSLTGKTTLTLRLVGFYTGGGTLGGLTVVLADRSAAAALGPNQAYTIFAVHLPPAEEDADLQRIRQAVPGVATLGDTAEINQIDAVLDNIVQAVESVAALAALAGVILIANTVALAMLERRREIGILKAIGHTSRSVLGMVLVENGMLGLAGATCALLLVSLTAAALSLATFHSARAEGAPAGLVIALAAATIATCTLVAGVVAWHATLVRPLEVLRYD